ncbi:MAG: hypothetical protein ABI791_14455 [Acidobacteriota bacterium]
MLRCPRCGNTYTDETLRFCLADGTSLVPANERNTRADEPATVRMETPARPTEAYEAPAKAPRSFKIFLGVIALLAIAGSFVVVAALIYFNKNRVRQPPAAPASPPAASQNVTPDAEKERLQRELADAQKKLDEQKNAPDSIDKIFDGLFDEGSAKVNSPGDGFLALRVLPDAKAGQPLAKIPHGTTIALGFCQEETSKVSGRSGHWCMTSYDGKAGWVFDAWLDKTAKK